MFMACSCDYGIINIYSLKEINDKIKESFKISNEDELKKFENEYKEENSMYSLNIILGGRI